MKKLRNLTRIIFLLLLSYSISVSVLYAKDDRSLLLEMKKQLGDPAILRSWVEGFDFCNSGRDIACTGTGRVSQLFLLLKNVSTPFPLAICGLTELQWLSIQAINHGLYGSIPSCINKLVNLRILSISARYLSGPIPDFSSNTNLWLLDLSGNQISGTIPPSISAIPHLCSLYLSSNNLTGTIPPDLVRASRECSPSLRLSNNNLTGELPRCYGQLEFSSIDVGSNQLTGDASFLFGEQKGTSWIDLSSNNFEFDLSSVQLPMNLVFLNLSHNKIWGKVPVNALSIEQLNLDLSHNELCGEMPKYGYLNYYHAEDFANNACLCGHPLPPC